MFLQTVHTIAIEDFRSRLESFMTKRLLVHPRLSRQQTPEQIAQLQVIELGVNGKERGYWEGSIKEVNQAGRRADGVAPAIARRG